ncbi:MAG: hypothetical protein ACI4TE_06050 [Alphaproteobacteria bacterium]
MKKFAYTIAFGMILGVVTSAQAVTVNTEFQYAEGFSNALTAAETNDNLVAAVTDQTDDSGTILSTTSDKVINTE